MAMNKLTRSAIDILSSLTESELEDIADKHVKLKFQDLSDEDHIEMVESLTEVLTNFINQ